MRRIGNLVHPLFRLEFPITFGTFKAVFCIMMLNNHQEVLRGPGLDTDLVHILFRPEFAVALRAWD